MRSSGIHLPRAGCWGFLGELVGQQRPPSVKAQGKGWGRKGSEGQEREGEATGFTNGPSAQGGMVHFLEPREGKMGPQ